MNLKKLIILSAILIIFPGCTDTDINNNNISVATEAVISDISETTQKAIINSDLNNIPGKSKIASNMTNIDTDDLIYDTADISIRTLTSHYDPGDQDPDIELVQISHKKKYSEFSVLKYNAVSRFKPGKNESIALYDLSDSASVGWGHNGTYRNWRLCYGLTAYIKGSKLYFKPYNDFPNTYKHMNIKTLKIESETKSSTLKNPNYDHKYIDLDNYDPGLYRIYCSFSNNAACSLYFYIDNNHDAYTCTFRKVNNKAFNDLVKRKQRLEKLIDAYKITPANSLDISEIIYPVSEAMGRTDTDLWANFARKLTKNCKTNEERVMMIHDWFTQNIIYDKWAVYTVKTMRPWYYNDFTGKYNLYTAHTGKCSDFANAFVIMCRALDIPCNTIESTGHAWNLVYINNQWKEIDLTVDINSYYWTEDMTKPSRPKVLYCYDSLDAIYPNGSELPLFINQILTDQDIIKGKRSYYDTSLLDNKTTLEKFGTK